jgi:hypothetical protein
MSEILHQERQPNPNQALQPTVEAGNVIYMHEHKGYFKER